MSGFFTEAFYVTAGLGELTPVGAALTGLAVIGGGIATALGIYYGYQEEYKGSSSSNGGDGGDKPDPPPSGLHDPDADYTYSWGGMHIYEGNEIGYRDIVRRRRRIFIKSYMKKMGTALAVAVPTYVGRRRLAKAIHNWRHGDNVPHTPLTDQVLRATRMHFDPFDDPPPRRRRYRYHGNFRYRPH